MAEQPWHCGCYFYLASVHALVSSPRCEGVSSDPTLTRDTDFNIYLGEFKWTIVVLIILSRYICTDLISANGAYVGLAPPGDAGSWQRECKVLFAHLRKSSILVAWAVLFVVCAQLSFILFFLHLGWVWGYVMKGILQTMPDITLFFFSFEKHIIQIKIITKMLSGVPKRIL